MRKDLQKNIENAQMLSKSRLMAFKKQIEESEDENVVDFKKRMVKIWMENPEVFKGLMKSAPKEFNNLIQKYGGK